MSLPLGPVYSENTIVGWVSKTHHVRCATAREVRPLILANHYSKTVTSSYLHLEVLDAGGVVVEALQFGAALNPKSGGNILPGVSNEGWCELNRMWIADSQPRNTESHVISLACKIIHKKYPGKKFVQSFADER